MLAISRSARVPLKHWKLSLIAIFSLTVAMALGILAISVANTALLLAPAGAAPDRLVAVYNRTPEKDIHQFSYPDYEYSRSSNHVFADVAAVPNSIAIYGAFDDGRLVKLISRPVSDN